MALSTICLILWFAIYGLSHVVVFSGSQPLLTIIAFAIAIALIARN